MTEPNWIPIDFLLEIHSDQIAEHGGADGVRDLRLLESATARTLNAYGHGATDLCVLAALYGVGIIQNHPFVDGNKRTGLIAIELFLEVNDLRLIATDEETLASILAVASGEWKEPELTEWLQANVVTLPDSD